MKIALIVDTYLPSPKSAAKHFYDLAQELFARGHEPTVVTPSSGLDGAFDLRVEDHVRVLRIRTPVLKASSRILRVIREAALPFVVWKQVRKVLRDADFDLLVFYSPTIFWGPLVGKMKRLFGCPSYLFLRDIFPQWAVDAGLLRKGPVYYLFRAVELHQYSVADMIAVQSHGDLRHFEDQPERLRKKVEVVYNWAPANEGSLPVRNFRKNLGLEQKTIFFFGGTFGQAQNMDAIVRLAIALRSDDSIAFLLAGSGTEADRLKTWVAREGLRNFQFLPALDQREYLALVSEIDIGLVSLSRELTTHNIPGKSLSYAYFSKPVLASINPQTEFGTLVNKFEAGLICEAGDDDLFRRHAVTLAASPEIRRRLGINNRRMLETKFSVQPAIEALMRAATLHPRHSSRSASKETQSVR